MKCSFYRIRHMWGDDLKQALFFVDYPSIHYPEIITKILIKLYALSNQNSVKQALFLSDDAYCSLGHWKPSHNFIQKHPGKSTLKWPVMWFERSWRQHFTEHTSTALNDVSIELASPSITRLTTSYIKDNYWLCLQNHIITFSLWFFSTVL